MKPEHITDVEAKQGDCLDVIMQLFEVEFWKAQDGFYKAFNTKESALSFIDKEHIVSFEWKIAD